MDMNEQHTGAVIASTCRRIRTRSGIKPRSFLVHAKASRVPAGPSSRPHAAPGAEPSSPKATRPTTPSPEGRPSKTAQSPHRGTLQRAKDAMRKRNAPLRPATPRRTKRERRPDSGGSPKRRHSRSPRRLRLREDRDAELAELRRSPGGRHHRSRGGTDRDDEDLNLTGYDHRLSSPPKGRGPKYLQFVEVDRAIRAKRQELIAKNINNNAAGPLGPQFCQSCGISPPHICPEDCEAIKYATGVMPSRRGVIPCAICGAQKALLRACPFQHSRCSRCKHLGHICEECPDRSSEEWLVFFLLHVHRGRLTRMNPDGPILGQYGFGDITGLSITDPIKRLIQSKRQSLETLQATYPDEPDPETEMHAAWMMLIAEQRSHQQQVEQDQERLQNDLVRRVAQALERSGRSAPKKKAKTRSSTGGRSVAATTKIVISPATPDRRPETTSESSDTSDDDDEEDDILAVREDEVGTCDTEEERELLAEPMEVSQVEEPTEPSTSSGSKSETTSGVSGGL